MKRNQLFIKKALNLLLISSIGFLGVMCSMSNSGQIGRDLEKEFATPPATAKPRVWWHWMSGNVTKEGIRADLEWMNRIGIGGFQNFDANMSTPQAVENRLVYMTPDWKDAFRFTTELADSLNLEMAIAGSPGWSESGGPWVKPEEAMKKYVWTETRIEGGQAFEGKLPHPPTTNGTFQNMGGRSGGGFSGEEAEPMPEYYEDIAVIAVRADDNSTSMGKLNPKVTSSGGEFTLSQLTDGDVATSVNLPSAPVGQASWIQFEYSEPQTIQSVTVVGGSSSRGGFPSSGGNTSSPALEVSSDGRSFSKVIDISGGSASEKTLTFAPVVGKYFRYSIITPKPQPAPSFPGMGGMFGGGGTTAPQGIPVAELVLYSDARVNRFEDKAAFSTATDLALAATLGVSNAIDQNNVIDLTSQMASDGTLSWTAPEGKWIVLRFGYSLLGTTNHPASPEATGFEVDKLNLDHIKSYWVQYLDQYLDATGGLMGEKGLQYVITDSFESGAQNWTDNMIEEFNIRRGYDITPWMPVLVGYVIESAEASDRFLFDFRRTLEEMMAEYHYDALTDILSERGMGRYTESHENGRALIADGMEVKRRATVPMSATWMNGGFGGVTDPDFVPDIRESASVSHIYGKQFVAAESFTAGGNAYSYSPETIKPTADKMLANGLNRFVIHTSVHQPLDDKFPGFSLGPFGQWFTRHETWAEQASPWITYLTRCSHLLQQGNPIVDVAYFYGHDNNITALFSSRLPEVPKGYEYDFVNPDIVLNVLSVDNNGNIITPSGMSYKVLALDQNCQKLTVPILRKLREMVNAGATIVGDKPSKTPTLTDDPAEFESLVSELWTDGKNVKTVGKGSVYAGYSIQEVLKQISVTPDFIYEKPYEDTRLIYVHRNVEDVDYYFVVNRNQREENLKATFRVSGMEAEIWNPVTGEIKPASYAIKGETTTVELNLESEDAVFVMFKNKATENSRTIAQPVEQQIAKISDPWNIEFQAERGAPAQATFETLTSWNENNNDGIKYFSGTAAYKNTINVSSDMLADGSRICIDLGEVKNLAEVFVNGESAGIVWKVPFKTDITDYLKEGDNEIEIKVTNLWVNRVVGDEQPDVTERITYTSQQQYQANSPLLPSGLMGPVKLIKSTIQ